MPLDLAPRLVPDLDPRLSKTADRVLGAAEALVKELHALTRQGTHAWGLYGSTVNHPPVQETAPYRLFSGRSYDGLPLSDLAPGLPPMALAHQFADDFEGRTKCLVERLRPRSCPPTRTGPPPVSQRSHCV
jgi:hypothetical protein